MTQYTHLVLSYTFYSLKLEKKKHRYIFPPTIKVYVMRNPASTPSKTQRLRHQRTLLPVITVTSFYVHTIKDDILQCLRKDLTKDNLLTNKVLRYRIRVIKLSQFRDFKTRFLQFNYSSTCRKSPPLALKPPKGSLC